MYADAAVFASSRLKPARARYVTVEIDPQLMRANTSPVNLPGTLASRGSTAPSIASTITLTPSMHSQTSMLSPTSTVGSMSGNVPSGPVGKKEDIINKKADPAQGLYQTCSVLRDRLLDVPDFDKYLEKDPDSPPDEVEDPVSHLWRVFKKGSSLCALFNALMPKNPIAASFLPPNLDAIKFQKQATFYFLKGIQEELSLNGDNAFMISHLYSEDTNGFVKVTKTVNRILEELEKRNLLIKRSVPRPDALAADQGPKSNRSKVIEELVNTERKYVQDLEALQDYMTTLQESGIVTSDTIHHMFLNLNALVDFQRRFLIRVETLYNLPPEQQRWGKLFLSHEHSFDVYEPYCANFKSAQELAFQEATRLSKVTHPVSSSGVAAFLIKPVQRICKYPLLLRDMIKYSEQNDSAIEELTVGMNSIERVNLKVNEAIRKADMAGLVVELSDRVDDWKGHKLDTLGDLLLHGQFTISKGDAKQDVEREYHIYLFETILLCCKEIAQAKAKSKTKRGAVPQTPKPGTAKPPLQLKGRIYAKNITHIISLAKNGSYTLQIFWKGDSGIENFIIRHRNEESLNQWKSILTRQYNLINHTDGPGVAGIAGRVPEKFQMATDFMWPSIDRNEDEQPQQMAPDDSNSDQEGTSNFPISRNGSSSDLKQHSSGWSNEPPPPQPQLPRHKFQPPGHVMAPPLTLNTQRLMNSPPNLSYFSPINETPSSGPRGSNAYPFPRQSTPNYEEQQSRFSSGLPMQRTASRENSSSSLQPAPQSARMQRPSLPGIPGSTNAMMQQQRTRSASSPQLVRAQTGPVPTTPAIPHQYQQGYQSYHNSNGHSPTSPINGPLRNGSPSVQLDAANGRGSTRSHLPPQVKVRVSYGSDVFVIIVPYSITYKQLMDRIEHKVSICGGMGGQGGHPLRIKYQDEDGDYISMSSDDDVQMAFDVFCDQANQEGTVGVVTLTVVT